MSVVTGILLTSSVEEDQEGAASPWQRVNAWLGERRFGSLRPLDDQFGGEKHPQMLAAGGGYNYFPEAEFQAFVMALPWQFPENVLLIVQPEEGPTVVCRPASCI